MLLGYLEFLALLFIPGAGTMLLFRVHLPSITEDLGLAFGLSLSIDVLAFVLKTSGLLTEWLPLGISAPFVETILSIWLAVLAVGLVIRRKLPRVVKPSRSDLYVLLLTALQAGLVLTHFVKFPIFPEFSSTDFAQHVLITNDLQTGLIMSVPSGVLYYGIHGLLAALQASSGGVPLAVTQRGMGILVSLSPLIFYAASIALLKSQRAAIFATFVYVAGGFIWFGSVFNAGLYANFLGVLCMLFVLIASSLVIVNPRRLQSWVIYVLSIAGLYFSHYSALTIVPALLALPVLDFVLTRKLRLSLIAIAVLPVIPAAVAFAFYPHLVTLLLGFAAGVGSGGISGNTALSSLFGWFPFLQFLILEVTSDSASIFLMTFAALGIYLGRRQRDSAFWIALVWLVTLAVASPQTGIAWRYSYIGLVPLVVLSAAGLDFAFPAPKAKEPVRRRPGGRPMRVRSQRYVVALLLLLLVAGSWGTTLAGDALNNPGAVGQAQYDVYHSMTWFANNTPPDGRLISVTDSKFNYTGVVTGRSAAYSPQASPGSLLSQVRGEKDVYVALTRVGTISVSQEEYANLISSYHSDSHFILAYNNSDVQIYSINTTAA